MRTCTDDLHVGENPLPDSEFYFNNTRGYYFSRCIPCHKRKATADQKRRRKARKEQGLPVGEAEYKRWIERQRLRLNSARQTM